MIPQNETTKAFWDATRSKLLVVQRCKSCGTFQHYPRPHCTSCFATTLEFVECAGTGTVYSFSTVMRSPSEDFEAPYTVALVRLDEGVQLMTNITGVARCDMRVVIDWRALPDGRHLPIFKEST